MKFFLLFKILNCGKISKAELQKVGIKSVIILKDDYYDNLDEHFDHFLNKNPNFDDSYYDLNNILQITLGYVANLHPNILKPLNDLNSVLFVSKVNKIKAYNYIQNNINLQYNSTWGLARLNSKKTLIKNKINNYYYNELYSGQDVNVYVIDSGINTNHSEFENRAKWGKTFIKDDDKILDQDLNGHGTHVAGIIGSKTFGVAKKVNLIAVKALDENGDGDDESLIKSIEFAYNDALSNNGGKKGNIINLSIGGELSKALNHIVKVTSDKIIFINAVGNEYEDSCLRSPSSELSSISVGSMNIDDNRSSFSNYGRCIDLYAPGEEILSTWIDNNDSSTRVLSGTSMAAPFVSGIAAIKLSKSEKIINSKEMKFILKSVSLTNKIKGNIINTNNLLLISDYTFD